MIEIMKTPFDLETATMTEQLVKSNDRPIVQYTQDQVELIKRTIAKGATNDELQLFLGQCQRTGLDPFSKQIYFVKYGNQMSIITGIDGYRAIAHRTGLYQGENTTYEENNGVLIAARCEVFKRAGDKIVAFTGYARFSEYCPQNKGGGMWTKMPYAMLGKCAEALALRKAFPNELSGIYTREEMRQANNNSFDPSKPNHLAGMNKLLNDKKIFAPQTRADVIKAMAGRPSEDLDEVLEELLEAEIHEPLPEKATILKEHKDHDLKAIEKDLETL